MTTAFVFDVDGTITESRQKITFRQASHLQLFLERNDCYLLTGSDFPKTKEQLQHLTKLVRGSYQCAGNELWVNDTLIESSPILEPSQRLDNLLSYLLEESKFPYRTGNHVDYRAGMLNFSIVGRGATESQRLEYIDFDRETGERKFLVDIINKACGDEINAQIAGKTGIDIFQHGRDKGQVYEKLKSKYDHIFFFGDDCQQGGNDYPFAVKCDHNDRVYHVSDPDETLNILSDLVVSYVAL
jgi:phosphomannomutase